MSVEKAIAPDSPVRLLLEPEEKDLGEFVVRRTLPATKRQRVGPFIFFDHMGPVDFAPGSGVDVRPHPHIGLATITYLFEGRIMHRDNLGNAQVIEQGAVNWMTAGKGIVHSERTPPEQKRTGSPLHGLQVWVALPVESEECEPRFEHYPEEDVPVANLDGVSLRVIVGSAYGCSSPVRASSETLYVEANLEENAWLSLPADVDELAIYVVDGEVSIGECLVGEHTMAIIEPGAGAIVHAVKASKLMLLGGASLPGKRYLWWNFVSSSRKRMNKAKADWKEKRFPDVPGETEFIPLPD
jgi:redox-sensitive bicupin YhaK (pirin superfamily)